METSELVQLVDYDPGWEQMFEVARTSIVSALGNSITAIHHVGSTLVPGLCAKPILDICVESERYAPDEIVIDDLAQFGFTHHGEAGVPGRHGFAKGAPRTQLHWCPVNGAIAQAAIQFRDALRANPALRDEYAQVKRASAMTHLVDGLEYNLGKEPFICAVLRGS